MVLLIPMFNRPALLPSRRSVLAGLEMKSGGFRNPNEKTRLFKAIDEIQKR